MDLNKKKDRALIPKFLCQTIWNFGYSIRQAYTGGPRNLWFLVPKSNHELWISWILRTVKWISYPKLWLIIRIFLYSEKRFHETTKYTLKKEKSEIFRIFFFKITKWRKIYKIGGVHELWNHEMRGSPVPISERSFQVLLVTCLSQVFFD